MKSAFQTLIVAVFALALSAGQAICACPAEAPASSGHDAQMAAAHGDHGDMAEHCADEGEAPIHEHAPDGKCGHGSPGVSATPFVAMKAALTESAPVIYAEHVPTAEHGVTFAAQRASWRPPPDGPPKAPTPVDLKIRQLI